MKNVAVVGFGYAGRAFHSYLIGLEPGLNLYAIATRNPERQAQARELYPQVRIVATLDELLDDPQVDLIVLATPHDTHCELAIRAMNAGKHVVTDKIVAMNAEETIRMAQAAQSNNVLFSVFHNRRWDWDFLTLKKAIAEGYLGEPYLFESAIMRYGKPRGWRAIKARSGGILYDWGAHLMDQALLLVDAPIQSVYCQIQYRREDTDIGSYGLVNLNFANGVIFRVEIGNLAAAPRPRFQVFGDRGAFVKTGLDPQERYMVQGRIDDAEEEPEHQARVWTVENGATREFRMPSVRGSWRNYYRNIAAALNEGAPLEVTPEQMIRLMKVYDAAMLSADNGVAVPLNV